MLSLQMTLPSKVFELPAAKGTAAVFVAVYGMGAANINPVSDNSIFLIPNGRSIRAVRLGISAGVMALAALMILALFILIAWWPAEAGIQPTGQLE